METKKWWKSKRVWGIVTCAVGKLLPVILPESAPVAAQILNFGALLFGYGCVDAKQPVKF